MTSHVLGTPAELSLALKTANPGDVLRLKGPWPKITIKGYNRGAITIASYDKSRPAVIAGMDVSSSSWITFRDLEWAFPAVVGESATYAFGIKVASCQDIKFVRPHIHGTADNIPGNDITGLQIRGSTNVSVEGGNIHDVRNGIDEGGNDKTTIRTTTLHDIRIDGIVTSSSTNLLIELNRFLDFNHVGHVGGGGDHSDAIQSVSRAGHPDSLGVTIRDNLITQGKGREMQGIFFGQGKYDQVTITDNLIVGGNPNAIVLAASTNSVVDGNTVAQIAGAVDSAGRPLKLWIKAPGALGTNSVVTVKDRGAALIAAHRASQAH